MPVESRQPSCPGMGRGDLGHNIKAAQSRRPLDQDSRFERLEKVGIYPAERRPLIASGMPSALQTCIGSLLVFGQLAASLMGLMNTDWLLVHSASLRWLQGTNLRVPRVFTLLLAVQPVEQSGSMTRSCGNCSLPAAIVWIGQVPARGLFKSTGVLPPTCRPSAPVLISSDYAIVQGQHEKDVDQPKT
jgi:hypothetical protein